MEVDIWNPSPWTRQTSFQRNNKQLGFYQNLLLMESETLNMFLYNTIDTIIYIYTYYINICDIQFQYIYTVYMYIDQHMYMYILSCDLSFQAWQAWWHLLLRILATTMIGRLEKRDVDLTWATKTKKKLPWDACWFVGITISHNGQFYKSLSL